MGRSPNTPGPNEPFSEQIVQLQRVARVVHETRSRPQEWRREVVEKVNSLIQSLNEDAARILRGEGPVASQK